MGFNIYIFIIAVIIVGLYFYMNKNKEKKHEEKRYDLIVIFKEEKYTDIRINYKLRCFDNIGKKIWINRYIFRNYNK